MNLVERLRWGNCDHPVIYKEAADRIEMLEQIETNLCELHNIALARVAELEAALVVARDALRRGRPQIIGVLVQQDQDYAIAKINELLGGK